MIEQGNEFSVRRLSSDDVPERDRLEFVREIYGRAIVRHDIEPDPDSPFYWHSVLRTLPGVGLGSTVLSGVQTRRTTTQIDSDDFVLNITVAGKRAVRQLGREAVAGPGELIVSRSAHVGSCEVSPDSRCMGIRVPVDALAPMIADLDSVLVRTIPAGVEPLSLLLRYVDVLQDPEPLRTPEMRHLVVAHVHDLVALTLGATRDGGAIARDRGMRAARLHAIKADILANLAARDLSIDAVARRHNISQRYVRRLFESTGSSFSDFVVDRRLAGAHRRLTDPRFAAHTISTIAFAVGFGDLSYFNRLFRRRYGATPSEVRAGALRENDT